MDSILPPATPNSFAHLPMIPKGTSAALVFEFDDLHRLAVDIDFQTSSG
jgi:hypothetical protein